MKVIELFQVKTSFDDGVNRENDIGKLVNEETDPWIYSVC